jgi:hypothetical protein
MRRNTVTCDACRNPTDDEHCVLVQVATLPLVEPTTKTRPTLAMRTTQGPPGVNSLGISYAFDVCDACLEKVGLLVRRNP